ncbi:MAG: DUF58 domain-containing protein [Planctomycetota bacterium]|nr:DUF58 domain-containing protein [Planctomycetota bacterium]
MSDYGLTGDDDFALTAMEEGGDLLTAEFVQKLSGLDLISKKILQGKVKGERKSRRKGQSVEFADYRPYVPGDDLRFLDWNIYARLDQLFIKLFLEEEDLHVSILIDASSSMDYGRPNKFRFAQRVAAALGYIGLSNYSRVGVGAFNSELSAVFNPMRGRRNVHKLMNFIAELQPSGDTDLTKAAKLFALKNKSKGIVILISDFMDRNGYEGALRNLLARKNDVFCLQVLADQEINPPLKGDLKLLDIEAGEETEITISGPLLKSYQNVMNNFIGGLKQFCVKRGVSYLCASTEVSFDQLVLGYLRERGLVR